MNTYSVIAQASEGIGGVQPQTIVGFIIIGLVAGILAKFMVPGKDPGGCVITILIGVAGSFIGGFLVSFFGVTQGGDFTKIAVATLGAIVLLVAYRFITK